MTQRPKAPFSSEECLEQELFLHYQRTGKLIPCTPEDVARAEAEDLKHPVTLSARLRNPDLFGESPGEGDSRVLEFPRVVNSALENLARAAREGGTISPEVETKMEEDRANAEREVDKDSEQTK